MSYLSLDEGLNLHVVVDSSSPPLDTGVVVCLPGLRTAHECLAIRLVWLTYGMLLSGFICKIYV